MKRYIALLEILNFESFVQKNTIEEVDRLYKELRKEIKDSFIEWRNQVVDKHDSPVTIELSFSDKHIIFTTQGNGSASLFHIVSAVQFTIAIAFSSGFPLLGCIHCGVILNDSDNLKTGDQPRDELYLRPGYWEAAEFLNLATVMGCVLTGTALQHFEETRSKNSYTMDDLMRFNLIVPLKDEKNDIELYTVNWMADQKMNFSRGFIASIFAKHNKIIDEFTNSIIDNTRAFISTVQAERLN